MTEDRLLKLLSIALRILARSKEGSRPPLRRRERTVLRILLRLSLTESLSGASKDFQMNWSCLVSRASWELTGKHGDALPKLRKNLETYIRSKHPGGETITYLVSLLSRVRKLIETEGLYVILRTLLGWK